MTAPLFARMKRWLKRIGLTIMIVAPMLSLWAYAYRDEIEHKWKEYLARDTLRSMDRYCTQLPEVDEVRLLRLDDKPLIPSLGTFDVSYSEPSRMYIVQEKILHGAEAQAFAALWRSQVLQAGSGVNCYEPHHVIQFRASGKCLAEAIPCFMCGNSTLTGFPFRTMISFDSLPKFASKAYADLMDSTEKYVGKHERASSNP
ncbi:hypothetical protein BH11VER1_BH11VER1_12420 [soil metagenome]